MSSWKMSVSASWSFADVVEERDALDAVQSALVQAGGLAEYEGVGCDAADVGARDGVVGVDRVEQRLERGRAKPLGLRSHAVLAEQQPARRGGADREWHEVFHGHAVRKNRTGGCDYIHA